MKSITVGISPKVAWPTLAAIALGTAVVVLGVLLNDQTIRDVGIGILGTAGVVIVPLGFQAPPGKVVPDPMSLTGNAALNTGTLVRSESSYPPPTPLSEVPKDPNPPSAS